MLLVLLLAVLGFSGMAWQDRYHHGPVSDHFDGRRFHMPGSDVGKGLLDVLRWQLTSTAAEWPESVPLDATAVPPARVPGSRLRVTWVGHATLLLQTRGLNLLTDPIWSDYASPLSFAGPRRVTPPGIAFEDLPPVDVVVVSHSHYDHMDLATLERLAVAHDPLFVMPLGNDALFGRDLPAARIVTLDWWQATAIAPQVNVHAVPVRHWSRRGPFDRNKALWAGFVLDTPDGPVYFGGDTGWGDGGIFRAAAGHFGGFRLALLPIGAYEPRWFMADQHINPREAVDAHRALQAERSLAMHFATFQLTDEAIDAPVKALQAAREAAGIPAAEFATVPIGGVLVLDGGGAVEKTSTDSDRFTQIKK